MPWKPDYTTVAALKSTIGIPLADTGDDALLGSFITAASRAIDTETRRQFGVLAAPAARRYTAQWRDELGEDGEYVIPIDDLQTVTGLEISYGGDPLLTYELEPANAVADGLAWERLHVGTADAGLLDSVRSGVTVTALFGWATVPTAVEMATRLQASRLFARRESPYGVAGSPELGSELRLLAKVDADVAVLVAGYHRDAVLL